MKPWTRTAWLAAILVCSGWWTGCDTRSQNDIPPAPADLLDRQQFIEVHAQLQLLEAAHRQHMLKGDRDRKRALLRGQILAKAGVTDSAFTHTYNWWYSQPEALPVLLKDVKSHVDSIQRGGPWN